MDRDPPLIVFEANLQDACIAPSAPLGQWSLASIRDALSATEPGATITLDLRDAPVSSPVHVAAVLWADDVARELGVALQIITPDVASAELLDFAGVQAPIFAHDDETLAAEPRFKRASAY